MAATSFASVKLPSTLVEQARQAAQSMRRSVASQIEYWATLGQIVEHTGLSAQEARAAIEQYEEIKERYDFIHAQKSDLLSAKSDLEATIHEIDMTATEKFMESFNLIRDNFILRLFQDVSFCPSNEHEEDNRTKHKRDDVRRKADCSGSPQYLKRKHILLSFCERTIDLPHWQVIKTYLNIILQIYPSVNNYRTLDGIDSRNHFLIAIKKTRTKLH